MNFYYLPREDPSWETDAELVADQIRGEVSDFLRSDSPRLFLDWLENDGLDEVGSPILIPRHLSPEQAAAHEAAVDALAGFLDLLDLDPDLLEERIETERDDRASRAADDSIARRKENRWI